MSSRWPRLAPKVSAVVRVATAIVAATTVVRSGTAVLPRPPSRAWRAPMVSGSGDLASPRTARRAATALRRAGVGGSWYGSSATSPPRRPPGPRGTRRAAPTPSTATFTSSPGDGSATRARPIGQSGDSATATANATIVATAAIDAVRTRPVRKRSLRVMPSARSTGWSIDSTNACRESAWIAIISVANAMRPASNQSTTAARCSVRFTFAAWSSWVTP